MKQIEMFCTENGKEPFSEWIEGLDSQTRIRVRSYVDRLALGLTGNVKSVGNGVFELKINFRVGYREYFGEVGLTIVLLLVGRDKGSQKRDIRLAKKYWREANV